jgi:DNA topoisomerase-1
LWSREVAVLEKDRDAKRGGELTAATAAADVGEEEGDDIGGGVGSAAAEVAEEGVGGGGGAGSGGGAGGAGPTALQHWTQPPPRYTEGSLVKALEEKAGRCQPGSPRHPPHPKPSL